MLSEHKGLFTLPFDPGFRPIVHLTDTRLTIGVLKPVEQSDGTEISLADMANVIINADHLSGVFSKEYAGSKLVLASGAYEYMGCSTFDLLSPVGIDEIVDFSRIEFYYTPEGELGWYNYFINSRFVKVDSGQRKRAFEPGRPVVTIWLPVMTGSLADARIVVFAGEWDLYRVGSTPMPTALDPNAFPAGGRNYLNYYFHSAGTGQVKAGGFADIPVQLYENADNSPLAASIKLKLEPRCGYVPHTRVTTDATGAASVRVGALGLDPGEKIKVKINTEHYANIGEIVVDVV